MERFLYQTGSIVGIQTTQKLYCDTLWFGFCHIVNQIYSFFDYVGTKTRHAVSSVFTFCQAVVPLWSHPNTQVTLAFSHQGKGADETTGYAGLSKEFVVHVKVRWAEGN